MPSFSPERRFTASKSTENDLLRRLGAIFTPNHIRGMRPGHCQLTVHAPKLLYELHQVDHVFARSRGQDIHIQGQKEPEPSSLIGVVLWVSGRAYAISGTGLIDLPLFGSEVQNERIAGDEACD
jgi:hypothetical protein